MLLEIEYSALTVHEHVCAAAVLLAAPRSTSAFEAEPESDPSTIHEPRTWFSVPSLDQRSLLDEIPALVIRLGMRMLDAKDRVVLESRHVRYGYHERVRGDLYEFVLGVLVADLELGIAPPSQSEPST